MPDPTRPSASAADAPARGLRASWSAASDFVVAQLPVIVLVALALVAAYWLLQPTPPRRLVLATGVPQSAYAEFGQRYAERLRGYGIEVELRETQGSAENLARLRDPASGIDVAFVQGGSSGRRPADEPRAEPLVSLGSLFHEPVWLFYRTDSTVRLRRGAPLTNLAQLGGWHVNVGAAGSGVPPLMRQLLAAHGLDEAALTLSELPVTPAVVEFLEGRLDALALASAPEAPMVQMLLRTPGVQLFGFEQAQALSRRFAFMSPVTLPRGIVDLAADHPPADVQLVAPTTSLIARETLHPALVELLVQAAQQIHGGAGWFHRAGEFPNPSHPEWPLADEARRVHEGGQPWLQRYLPFWLANLVDRMWLVLVSVIAVALPLSRVLPPLVEFRIRSRIFRWYAQLRAVEDAAGHRPAAELIARLDDIDRRVEHIAVPLSYADELYALRSHIQLVRRRVQAHDPTAAPRAPAP